MNPSSDVVIIGAGASGLTAALAAAALGARVTVLEKMDAPGGSTMFGSGLIAFAGTDMQARQGIEDSDELLFADFIEIGKSMNRPELVRAYVDNQLETYHWLRRLGIDFNEQVDTAAGQSVPRSHVTSTPVLIALLHKLATEEALIKIRLNAAAKRLIRRPDDARVVGVLVEQGGEETVIEARAGVVICSGGFTRNPDLIRTFVPLQSKAYVGGGVGNTGDGLLMAWGLGAAVADVAYVQGTFGKHPFNHTVMNSLQAIYKGGIIVNRLGKRFADESLPYKLLGTASLQQPGDCNFQIFDHKVFERGEPDVKIYNFPYRLEEGTLLRADTLEALAEMISVPAEALTATVERYNAFVRAGVDEDFGRLHLTHRYGSLCTLEEAPFYAYPSTAGLFTTFGGVAIDGEMRVIDVFGKPIAGLWAAGEVIGGLHGAAYMSGAALGNSLTFGRLAGGNAIRAMQFADAGAAGGAK